MKRQKRAKPRATKADAVARALRGVERRLHALEAAVQGLAMTREPEEPWQSRLIADRKRFASHQLKVEEVK